MADDGDKVVPLWKRNLEKATTPASRAKGADTRRLLATIRNAIYDSLDTYGAQAYMRMLMVEHPAVFGALLGKMLPIEIEGSVDHSLTVRVVTQVGEDLATKIGLPGGPRDVGSGQRVPAVPHKLADEPVTIEVIDG